MTRSIHRTRRELAELEQFDVSNREQLAKDLEELKNELKTKRRIKRQVRSLRQSGNSPAPAPIDTLPVLEHDRSPHVHFPANADDVRAILRALPAGVVDGLEAVELRAGADRQREWVAEEAGADFAPDPFTNRFGAELMPGVYSPLVLGCYIPRSDLITLFGYVYEPDLPNCGVVEFYLRLKMLSTLVHEVAHHHDFTFRIERGRWRGDDREKCEIYAEKIEHEWVAKYVVPYLESEHANDTANMQRWLMAHLGTTVPLHMLAGDPRSTARNGGIYVRALFSTHVAFEELVTMVAQEQPVDKIRVEFAEQLHFAEEYEIPKRILQSLLDTNPKNVDALTLRADIAEHEIEYPLARELARRALAIDRDHLDALKVLADVYEETAEWKRLLRTADRILVLCSGDRWEISGAEQHRATAFWHLGRFDEAKEALDTMRSTGLRTAERQADRLERRLNKQNEN